MKVMVSGGFDPPHKGHVRLVKEASQYGEVIVALNSDAWLVAKKGKSFMDWEERREVLEEWRHVFQVVEVDDSDGTVCEALRKYHPDYFANGGGRLYAHPQEAEGCRELGIWQLFKVGGDKIQSSSLLCAT